MSETPPKAAPKKPPAMAGAGAKTPPGTASKSSAAPKKPSGPAHPKSTKKPRGFFAEPSIGLDNVVNEQVEYDHHRRLLSMVFSQSIAVASLVLMLIFLAPFLRPIYHYYARDPAGNVMAIDPLTMPNMTNRAVLSWAVTSVTEIMTIGFGDMLPHLNKQKTRFTGEGWTGFVNAFYKQRIGESFREEELVLTTVPSDTAVILAQGNNTEGVYEWKVQVPVIMTYATNNNVTQGRHAIITLTIVRSDQSSAGVAIKNWLVQ